MVTKRKLASLSATVLKILQEDKAARDSDTHLYIKVCEAWHPAVLGMSFFDVLMDMNALGLPPFESVRRSRQKIQQYFPNLRSTEKVRKLREKQEQEYMLFTSAK